MSSRTLIAPAALLLLLSACATSRTTTTTVDGTPRLEPAPAEVVAPTTPARAFDPSGRWELLFELGGESLPVVMELVKTPSGAWGGTLSSQMGGGPIEKATLEGNRMAVSFTAPDGGPGSMNLTFSDKTVEGTWSASGMSSRLTGSRP